MKTRYDKELTPKELAAMPDSEIDFSDIPEANEEFWKSAKVVLPENRKTQLTMRLDTEIVQWFRSQGRGYQTRINAVLRSYYEAHRNNL